MIYHWKDIQIAQLFCQGHIFKFCLIYELFLRIVNNGNNTDIWSDFNLAWLWWLSGA
jgi:hypothetical protein